MSQTLTALGIVLGAVVMLRLVLKGVGLEARLRTRGGGLRVVASCALGPRQRLHIVELEGERILLGATDHSVNLLRKLPAKSPEPTPEPTPAALRRAAASWRFRLRRLAGSVGLVTLVGVLLFAAGSAWAQGAASVSSPTVSLDVGALTQPERISGTLEILLVLTLFSIAPSILLMATCFTRVVIVLSLLRQAVGIHQLPPNQVIVGLALAITLFVMAPVGQAIRENALDPYVAHEIDAATAGERAVAPVREFLLHHTREKDLDLFVSLSEQPPPSEPEEVALTALLPSFILSELRTAFEIGFTLFLPFLIIDMVIASILISLQMIVLPPMLISLPFKIMLFVLVDGWNLMVGSLVSSLS